MTDDEIIRMANEAGWDAVNLDDGFGMRLKRFTELARRTTEPVNQPEALPLADLLGQGNYNHEDVTRAAAELRRLHAEVERLREVAGQALGSLKSCSGVPHWPALQQTITTLEDALGEPIKPEALPLADAPESPTAIIVEQCKCGLLAVGYAADLKAEVERLRADAADFHMAYRMKCDEETKAQAVEIERLRAAGQALSGADPTDRYDGVNEMMTDSEAAAWTRGRAVGERELKAAEKRWQKERAVRIAQRNLWADEANEARAEIQRLRQRELYWWALALALATNAVWLIANWIGVVK